MSSPGGVKGRLNLDSPQREAVDKTRPFVTPLNGRDIAVIEAADCPEIRLDFEVVDADPGIRDHRFIEQ